MVRIDEELIKQYPFFYTSVVKDLSDEPLQMGMMDLSEILSGNPEGNMVREYAKEVIKKNIEYGSNRAETREHITGSQNSELDIHIPAYIYAKILLFNGGSDFIIKRFSMGVAQDFEKRINEIRYPQKRNDLLSLVELASKIGKLDAIVGWNNVNMPFWVEFSQFLKYSANIGLHWNPMFFRIIKKESNKSYVVFEIDSEKRGQSITAKIGRFIREVVYSIVLQSINGISTMPTDEIIRNNLYIQDISFVKEFMKNYEIHFSKDKLENIVESAFPPCIVHILRDMGMYRDSEIHNVSHAGRFSLVTFFSNISMPKEKIMTYFTRLPDYKEEYTRYQVNHIVDGNYKMADCETMKANGLCYSEDDSLCQSVVHPLEFYRKKLKYVKSSSKSLPDNVKSLQSSKI